jgi:hypothetical protein
MEGGERQQRRSGCYRQHDADGVDDAVGDHFGARIVPAPDERDAYIGVLLAIAHYRFLRRA